MKRVRVQKRGSNQDTFYLPRQSMTGLRDQLEKDVGCVAGGMLTTTAYPESRPLKVPGPRARTYHGKPRDMLGSDFICSSSKCKAKNESLLC